ncbi:phosphatase PAP2 family protein [Streptomyces sp. JJ36]|nr:phosphatase PAP2 family protein [Streptomyces sp. JJ36]
MVLALLAWQVGAEGPLLRVDATLRDASAPLSSPGGSGGVSARLAESAADLGHAAVAYPVLALGAAALSWRRRSPVPLVAALLAAGTVPAVVLPLKTAFARSGPDGLPLGDYPGFFPSGHAVTAVVAYGTLAVLCARPAAYAAASLLGGAAGAGLVLRGHHWATDVAAGWALAVLLLWVPAAVCRRSGRCLSRSGPGPEAGRRAGGPPGRGTRPPRAGPAPGSPER